MNPPDNEPKFTLPASFLSHVPLRKLHRQNIVQRLFDQQYHFSPRIHPFVITNKLHQNLVPNFSIENVSRPNCSLRKFSHDGRYLMAFSADITSVELYEYQGPGAAAQLLSEVSSNYQDFLNYRGEEFVYIRRNIFYCFFKHMHSIRIGHLLNRDCCLFTEDNRFLIVASTTYINETTTSYHERYQNNESITIGSQAFLEDYSFYLINLEHAQVFDYLKFKTDKINLAFNGIYLYKHLFAVLSVQHQTIYLYYILPSGCFGLIRKIGRFCYEADQYFYESIRLQALPTRKKVISAFREVSYNSLKHRLLTYAFKRSKRVSEETGSPIPLVRFYRDFDFYVNLRMSKMQLLDEEHILIRYDQESTINKSSTEHSIKSASLFVIYNWKTTEILNYYTQYSEALLKAYENFYDYFRHPRGYPCSHSNNDYSRRVYNQSKKKILESKNGNYKETIRKILASLPHNCQTVISSPYLDFSLFSYDEKVIDTNEKARYPSEVPISFYNRDTGRFSFRLHTGQSFLPFQHPNQFANTNRRINFIFHPTDPFILSVQRHNSHYMIHFHIRHFNPVDVKVDPKPPTICG